MGARFGYRNVGGFNWADSLIFCRISSRFYQHTKILSNLSLQFTDCQPKKFPDLAHSCRRCLRLLPCEKLTTESKKERQIFRSVFLTGHGHRTCGGVLATPGSALQEDNSTNVCLCQALFSALWRIPYKWASQDLPCNPLGLVFTPAYNGKAQAE